MPWDLTTLAKVKASLPRFNGQSPFDLSACSSALHDYYRTYGFELLLDSHAQMRYFFGYLPMLEHRVAVHQWRAPSAKATVLIVHGLFDHVGLYLNVIGALLDAGYSVIAIDLLGHGLSSGDSAAVNSFMDYAALLGECIAYFENKVEGAFYALGQSTGGAAVMSYLLTATSGPKIEKTVLCAPLIRPKGWWVSNAMYMMLHRFIERVPRSFTVNSHDEAFCDFLKHQDPLQPQHISVPWVGAMREWIRQFPHLGTSEASVLVIQGDNDGTVDWPYNLSLIQAAFPKAGVVMVPGAMHHLVCEGEAWRKQVFDACLRFFEDESVMP